MVKGERPEILRRVVQERFAAELAATLRRRHPAEAKLAGALRVLLPLSGALRDLCAEAGSTLVKRGSLERELYASIVRGLAESGDARAGALIHGALAREDAGGLPTLCAAAFCRDPGIAVPLAKVAASRQTHLAFAAEVARIARGESNGAHLGALAPKIKESHRIALCGEVLLPLSRAGELPATVAAPLAVLRDSERHLGRWLVVAEVGRRANDQQALREARKNAVSGPESSRAAWSLLAWALEPSAPPPVARPTLELISRLSDRPSADRDTAFLFRLAAARVPTARPMLEGLARTTPLGSEIAVRAAMHLGRDHGQARMRAAVVEATKHKLDHVRGVAAAALWDLGEEKLACSAADAEETSRSIASVTWGALVRAAAEGAARGPLLVDPTFRRVRSGWLD